MTPPVTALVTILTLSCACSSTPTTPTPASTTVTPTTSAVVSWHMEVLPISQMDRASLMLVAYEADGRYAAINASCAASSGFVDPPVPVRVMTPYTTLVKGSSSVTTIVCTAEGQKQETVVDLSAWTIAVTDLYEDHVAEENTTRVYYSYSPRIYPSIPIERQTIDWGDGTPVEQAQNNATIATYAAAHHYRRPGLFHVVQRATWNGGEMVSRILLERTCRYDLLSAYPEGYCMARWWRE